MKFFKRKPSEQDVLNALESLIKKGLVEKVIVDGIEQFRLTEKGLKEAEKS
jgi:DNA-binding PadR family transcriptional regulator